MDDHRRTIEVLLDASWNTSPIDKTKEYLNRIGWDGCRPVRLPPLFIPTRPRRNFLMKQEELRKRCRFLKWEKGIDYQEIAKAIGMNKFSFYNFISGRRAKLGYRREWLLENYLKEKE